MSRAPSPGRRADQLADAGDPSSARGRGGVAVVKRALIAAATAFLSVNLWTGAPLLALWVGSHFAGSASLSMAAVVGVVIVLAILVFAIAFALTWLNHAYDRLTHRPHDESRAAWLRGTGMERRGRSQGGVGSSAFERIVMVSVYVAVFAFLLWFFVFAGSPLPSP